MRILLVEDDAVLHEVIRCSLEDAANRVDSAWSLEQARGRGKAGANLGAGVGLGLAIASRYAALIGGRLELEAGSGGRGLCATLHLHEAVPTGAKA